jgi:hypothetical protein
MGASLGQTPLFALCADFWNTEAAADLPREQVGDFGVARNGLNSAG